MSQFSLDIYQENKKSQYVWRPDRWSRRPCRLDQLQCMLLLLSTGRCTAEGGWIVSGIQGMWQDWCLCLHTSEPFNPPSHSSLRVLLSVSLIYTEPAAQVYKVITLRLSPSLLFFISSPVGIIGQFSSAQFIFNATFKAI